ncbi:MAG: D-alanine--D-alanine ligase family protein [Treponema lecithinolyticum]|uniref:D-alanine--D-alanine ligase family protein n=1 Tax=Treponema lecithinolyticum TaxID=53418 RepID=UPI003618CBBA
MTVAVLYGGKSGEHEVSLVSATSVVRAVNRTVHKIVLIGIAKNGVWYVQDESELRRVLDDDKAVLSIECKAKNAVYVVPGGGAHAAAGACTASGAAGASNGALKRADGSAIDADIVFPVLHGTYGEDGLVQGLLEMAELPYCGNGAESSALAMDKEKTKTVWQAKNLPIVPFVCICSGEYADKGVLKEKLDGAERRFAYPVFVKPCSAGSSVGASKARNRAELENAVAQAFVWDEKILIETCIDAREIECSVTGDSVNVQSIRSYTLGEIAPSHDFYDYEAKYTDPAGARLLIPAPLEKEQSQKIKQLAEKAYAVLDCSGLARVDFFVDKKTGDLYLNEINTMPGFTSISMFPKMCAHAGLKYSDLIELLLQQGLERFKRRRSLKTSR